MTPRWMDTLWPSASEVTFAPTTLEEREAFSKLIPGIVAAAPTGKLPRALVDLAGSVSFSLETEKEGDQTFWVLKEKRGHFHGAGAYVFRTGPAAETVIQAPHADFDLGTGTIGALMFANAPKEERPRVFMTNTVHRYKSHPLETKEDEDHPADVAHNPDHLFTVVTDLLARQMKTPRVIQLHGFGKSELPAREDLAAVASSGTQDPTPWAAAIAALLKGQFGEGVKLYPKEAKVLGGTTNAQGRILRAYAGAKFLHLELSSDTRKQLVTSDKLAAFTRALLETPPN